MQIIINGFDITQKEKDEWLQASTQFRLPYWDWARQQEYDDGYKGYGVPEVFTKDQISIISHDNTTKNVPNPLVKYVNPKLGADKQPLAMGDWDMGMLYRILDNNNDYMNRVLPVRATTSHNYGHLHGISGVFVKVQAATGFSKRSSRSSGRLESTTGVHAMPVYRIHNGTVCTAGAVSLRPLLVCLLLGISMTMFILRQPHTTIPRT